MTRTGLSEKPQPVLESVVLTQPDISNLPNCIEDVKKAIMDGDNGPEDPIDYYELRGRLETARRKLPPLYLETVYEPFIKALDKLGQTGFTRILLSDPTKEHAAGLMLDIAHAILQNGEGYRERATDAFQEVVSDLYDGFLSAEDRRGIKPPDLGIIPPLVKWGNPGFGPYTWPVSAASNFGLQTGIVSLPPAQANRGLLGWATLGHETGGHDILHADTGLIEELAQSVYQALKQQNMGNDLPEYWSDRIDETASDVMGLLNMGPAAGIGLIGYFRGIGAARNRGATLRNNGPENDMHPADILRGYLAAATVNLLEFDGASEWARILKAETDKDLSTIRLAGKVVSAEEARESARIVASTLVQNRMETLENHALGQVQNWRNEDENIVKQLRSLLTTANPLSRDLASGTFAAHVVAAAVTEAVSKDADIPMIYERMLAILKEMHDTNPSWGPLFVLHPGDISTHRVYTYYE